MTIPINLLQIIFIPLLFILPGYVTRLVILAHCPEQARVGWPELFFQCLLFSVILTGWLALTLTQWGWFHLPLLLIGNAGYVAVLTIFARQQGCAWRSALHPPEQAVWPLLGLLGLAALLFFHPHTFILGGADAGVYINVGANIARTGSWLIHNPDIASLSHTLYRELFREQPPPNITHYIQFPGFYLADDQPGLIIPQFYPLHPVWLAIFYSLGGIWASLFATPLWGLLGCLAVYFAARALFGHRTGLLAVLLLTITATQIWFSRYPTSEMLTQFLLFGGIYAFSLYIMDESPWMGVLAGLSLGQVTLVRIDMYFLLAVPVCYAIYLRLQRRLSTRHLLFFIPFSMQAAHSLLFARLQSWPYFYNTYRAGIHTLPFSAPFLVTTGVIVLILLCLLNRWAGKHPGWLQQTDPYGSRITTILAGLVVLAALYGYFLRPRLANTKASWYYWYGGNNIPNVEPYNLVRLGWYITPLGIALAVLGTWWILRHKVNARTSLFLGVGLFFSFLYLQNSRNNPHHIYVMRRYVPAVIPAFAIAAAYALEQWFARLGWQRWLATALTVILVGSLLYTDRVIIPHVEYQGALESMQELADTLGDDHTVILFNDDLPVSTGTIVGTPLHYLYGYTVFDLQERYIDVNSLRPQIAEWQHDNRRVLLAVGAHGVPNLFAPLRTIPLIHFFLDLPVMEVSYEHFPQQIWRYKADVQFYTFETVE